MNVDAVDPAEFAEAKAVASEILGGEPRSDATVRWFLKIIRTDPERIARFRAGRSEADRS